QHCEENRKDANRGNRRRRASSAAITEPHVGQCGGGGETVGQGCLTDRQGYAGRRASHADRGGTDAGRRCATATGPPNDDARAYQNLAIPPPVDGATGAPAGVADSRKEGDQTVTSRESLYHLRCESPNHWRARPHPRIGTRLRGRGHLCMTN